MQITSVIDLRDPAGGVGRANVIVKPYAKVLHIDGTAYLDNREALRLLR